MNLGRYNAKNMTVMIDGVYITGVGEDMVTGEKDEDNFSTSVGAQGDVVKSIINNTLGTVTLTVQTTSPQYSYLLGLAAREDEFPLWCINKTLGRRFGGSMASLKKYPTENHGTEAEDHEFEFQVFDYVDETA